MHHRLQQIGSRALALLMALVLCLGTLPILSRAQDTTYTQVTSADQFTSGTYYMVTDTGYAPACWTAAGSPPWTRPRPRPTLSGP